MINSGSISREDAKAITNLYLFGQNPAPEFYSDRIRPDGTAAATTSLNMQTFLKDGAGRYANPARSKAFETFFQDTTLEDGTYSWADIQNRLNVKPEDLGFNVSHYTTDIGGADYVWRMFIFGSADFSVQTLANTQFIVNGSSRTVENFTIKAEPDGFDFRSEHPIAKLVNQILRPSIDPWKLGEDAQSGKTREVEITFDGDGQSYSQYTESQFNDDANSNSSLTVSDQSGINAAFEAINKFITTAENGLNALGFRDDEILGYRDEGRFITAYGDSETNKNDDFTLKGKVSPFIVNQFIEYTLNIIAGEGNDEIEGYRNDDLLIGGAGDDILRGGRGNDMIYGDFDPEKSNDKNGIDTVDYSLVESGFIFNDSPDNGIEIVLSDEFINVLDDGTGGADILHSIEVIKGTEFIDTLKVENTNSFTDLKIQNFGGTPVTQDKDGKALPWEKVIQKVLEIETEFDLNIDANGKGVINFDGGEKITLEGFSNSGPFEEKPVVYIKGTSEDSVVNVESEGSYLIDVSDGKGAVTVGDGLDWIVLGTSDSSLSVSDTDVELNGDATYTLQGGDTEDRLFIKGSMVGIAPDEQTGAEKLFPILGGVAIAQDFTLLTYTREILEKSTYEENYDIDGDGNVEYHFLTRAVETELFTDPGSSAAVTQGENFSDDLDLYFDGLYPYGTPSSLFTYEMEGSDLIIYFSEDTFAVKIKEFSNGDYGINLSGPFNIVKNVAIVDNADESTGEIDNSAVTSANNAIKALNDDQFYKEFLPVFEEEDSPSPEENQNIEGTEQADTAIGKAGDDTIDTKGGDDRAYGGAGDDHITTGDGDDSAYGGSGNDTIVGGSGQGDDFYDGGLGNDTIVYSSASKSISVNLERGTAFGEEIDNDQLVSIENIVAGDGDDSLKGDDEDNQITGAAGDDNIDGKGGTDTAIYSGTRADYQITSLSNNRVRITDLRQDAPDGTDEVSNVEKFSFADGTFTSDALFSANNKPIIISDDLQTNEDESISFTKDELLLNDSDSDGDAISFVSAQSAENGQLIENSDGTFTFIPDQDFNGTAFFIYTITDGNGVEVSSTVNVEVAAVNDGPVIQTPMEDQNSAEDRPVNIVVPETLFSDIDGDILTLSATLADGTALPSWLTFDPDTKTFTGTPPADFNGSFNLKISATDGVEIIESVFALNIFAVNDGPQVGNDEGFEVEQNAPLNISPSVLLANDTDAEGDELTITSVGSALNGTVEMNADGQIIFTPNDGYSGEAYFLYTVSDENGAIGNGIVSLNVAASNSAPIVQTEIEDQTSNEDASWSFTIPANTFSDVDGDALTLSATLADGSDLPEWLSFDSATQTFSGTPPQDFNGDITLSVTASDGELEVSESFNLTINPVNDAPIAANDDSLETNEDIPLTITASSLLLNDSDVDGDVLTIINVDEPANGTVVMNSNGDIIFTPTANYNGPASFRYTVSDGNGGTATAVASLAIHAVNDAPTNLISSALEIEENSLAGAEVGMFSVTDVDLGDTHTYSIIGGTGASQFTFDGDKLIVVEGADLDYETTSSLTLDVLATDAAGLTTQNSFEISLLDDPTDNNGNDTDDIIYGTYQNDILDGEGGNDTIFGFRGNDHLIGGAGADKLYGGSGSDTADYSGSSDGVNVSLSRSYWWWGNSQTASGGDAEGDQLFSIENLIGSKHDDQLKGNWKNNRLEGGEGNDLLTGGWGRDQFVFKSGDDVDTITDFDTGYSFWGWNFSGDKVILDVDGFDDFADVQDAITSTGTYWSPETTIDFGNGDTLIFKGVHTWQLNANDFDFV